MDRTFAYPSMQPTSGLWLNAERNKMIALGYLAQGVLGLATVVDGLACTPTVPASLAVNIGPGAIYSQEPVDSVAYGSLGIDATDQIIKQGVNLPVTPLTLTPPSTSGQAINYLIQGELSEVDTNAAVLSFFNSAAPSVSFAGPGGAGGSLPTLRQCTVNLVAKAGAAATAGSQVTPSPDAGYVGLWVVTVANGATQITSAQISQYPAAPFIAVKLPQIPGWVQGGTWAWATDTGSANAIAVTLNPVPANISAGFEIWFKKAVTSTSTVAISVNGAANVAVVNIDGSALSSSVTMNAGVLIGIKFDGTSWRWINPQASTAVGSLTASSGEGVTVGGSSVVSLNYPGLTVENAVASTDLFSFFSQADSHHRAMSWANLVAKMSSALGVGSSAADGNMIVGNFAGAAPASGVGLNGDYAFDVSSGDVFGPKSSGAWPSTPVYVPYKPASGGALPIGSSVTATYTANGSNNAIILGSFTVGATTTSTAGQVAVAGSVGTAVLNSNSTLIPAGQTWTVVAYSVSTSSYPVSTGIGGVVTYYTATFSVQLVRTA
ncbi:MAG TPA: hypothetical protein VEF90_16430 [Xanthobacteraceae bacterium]|nr:hypothetical protein [Xanthobacteraceae bacterium]